MISKPHIRGALTTGSKWHFVVVDLDTDGDGAKYWVSELIEWTRDPTTDKLSLVPALIAGILSTWVSLNDLVLLTVIRQMMFAAVRFNRASKSSPKISGLSCGLKKKQSRDGVRFPCHQSHNRLFPESALSLQSLSRCSYIERSLTAHIFEVIDWPCQLPPNSWHELIFEPATSGSPAPLSTRQGTSNCFCLVRYP